jgi:hypothetical protein
MLLRIPAAVATTRAIETPAQPAPAAADPLDPFALPPLESGTAPGTLSASAPWTVPSGPGRAPFPVAKSGSPGTRAPQGKRSADDVLKKYMVDDDWRRSDPHGRAALTTARWILIIVGGLTLLVNGASIFFIATIIDDQLAESVATGEIDLAEHATIRQSALVIGYAFAVVGMLVGAVLIACGVLVHRYPVAATITGLSLYVGSILLGARFD